MVFIGYLTVIGLKMQLETIQALYHRAVAKCEANKAWQFEWRFAEEVAEYCASLCEEIGTPVAGCYDNKLTALADDCAATIREDLVYEIYPSISPSTPSRLRRHLPSSRRTSTV